MPKASTKAKTGVAKKTPKLLLFALVGWITVKVVKAKFA
jgi:hypothetical protein